ncbi:MAG: VWA domain-containing protein [candidate division Zixibacteria bacterium]|nr:VWA domain-containing protein [candidate division Zixibacteria bacterium]
MRFGSSQWLWALWAIPLIVGFLVWVTRRRLRLATLFAEPSLWSRLAGPDPAWPRRWRPVLLVIALVFLIVGVAAPRWGARAVMLKRRGLDIVVALDVSKSMLSADVKPNRLTFAKREIASVLDRLSGDRVGLVVFAGDAFVQCPLTLDASAARLLLDAVDVGSGGRPGTELDEAIKSSAGMFDQNERQFKILILVTDGEGTEGEPLDAAKSAAQEGVRIYTVGIGTPAGEPIPDFDEQGHPTGFKKDENGQVVLSKLDEITLEKIALAADGQYYRAGPSQMELDALFKELSTLEKKELEGRLFTEFEERFQYFLVPAFVFMTLEMALPLVRRKDGDAGKNGREV